MSGRYPRGERTLISPFHRFQPSDTVAWFEQRGVRLKTERDGRIFPKTDSSETIIECLLREARRLGIKLCLRRGVEHAVRGAEGGFDLRLSDGETIIADRLLLAIGGCRVPAAARLASELGHVITPPVPSLFTFHIDVPWLKELPGLAVEDVEASVPGTDLRERGPLLVTHWGVSGPVILRLSAWGARVLHEKDYRFPLRLNWLPALTSEEVGARLRAFRESQPGKQISNVPLPPLPRQAVGATGGGFWNSAGDPLGHAFAGEHLGSPAHACFHGTARQRKEPEQR